MSKPTMARRWATVEETKVGKEIIANLLKDLVEAGWKVDRSYETAFVVSRDDITLTILVELTTDCGFLFTIKEKLEGAKDYRQVASGSLPPGLTSARVLKVLMTVFSVLEVPIAVE